MIYDDRLAPYSDRYANVMHGGGEPLRIVAHLATATKVIGYDPIHFDGLLARLVVEEATEGRGLAESAEPYALPIPVHVLWRDSRGLPLYAASDLLPAGWSATVAHVIHKRAPTGDYSRTKSGKLQLRTDRGRWMERRMPLPAMVATELVAYAIGDGEEIARLLSGVTNIGKKRAHGAGAVAEWSVEPCDPDDCTTIARDGVLVRPTPEGAGIGFALPDPPSLVGWTPPQWLPSAWSMGWRTGARVAMP